MCRYESENEWLHPRRNGIATWLTAIFRFLPVTLPSRRGESRVHGYSSIRARSVASFRVCAISKKEGTFTPSELITDTKNRDFIPVRRMKLAASTLCKHPGTSKTESHSSHERDSARGVKNCRFNISRAAPWINCAVFRGSLVTQPTWHYKVNKL